MRVFAALPLPPEAAEALGRLQASLASRCPRLRLTRPAGLHLTLHFFGELADDEVARVASLWDDPVLTSPVLAVSFGQLGQFPPRGRPRVIWIDLGAGAGEVREFHGSFQQRLARLGYAEDPRGFSPHITLARGSGDAREEGWQEAAAPPRLDFALDACVLFQSILGPGGARYVALRTLRFGRKQQ